MPRLVFLALFLAATVMSSWPPRPPSPARSHQLKKPPPRIVADLNERMNELYNYRHFARLTKDLYEEDAIVEITKYGIKAVGHREIHELLKNTAFGKIEKIVVNRISQPNLTRTKYYVDATMTYGFADGRKVLYDLRQAISENGKFSHFIQTHIE